MQRVANSIISIGAIGLLALGGYLGFLDRTASATTVLGFAFLLVVLLLLAKFKHIKGFGFEAEMWEEKQIEAAALVDRLTLLSEAVSEQMALIASKLGLWGGSLTNTELADLTEQVSRLLQAAGASTIRVNEILGPVYRRIELNYWSAAQRLVGDAVNNEISTIHAILNSAPPEERDAIIQRSQISSVDKERYNKFNFRQFAENKTMDPLIAFARTCPTLAGSAALHAELDELNLDLAHFRASRSLRRRIDVAASPPRFTGTASG